MQSVSVNSHQLSEELLIVTAERVCDLEKAKRLSACCPCLNVNRVTIRDLWPYLKPVTPITSCLSGWFCPGRDGSIRFSFSLSYFINNYSFLSLFPKLSQKKFSFSDFPLDVTLSSPTFHFCFLGSFHHNVNIQHCLRPFSISFRSP